MNASVTAPALTVEHMTQIISTPCPFVWCTDCDRDWIEELPNWPDEQIWNRMHRRAKGCWEVRVLETVNPRDGYQVFPPLFEVFDRVDIQGPEMALQAAKQLRKLARIVSTSATL